MSLNDYIKIGEKIRALREAKGISQKEMAEDILGIPRSTYSNYENDNRVPDNNLLGTIADNLGVNVNELINGKRENPKKITVEASVKDTETFKELLGFIKDILVDERIDKSIRQEYYEKYLNEVEKR